MKRIVLFLSMLGLVVGLQAQVATVPMGGHVTGSGGEMTISLGQCATRTVYDTAVTVNVRTASLTEGVLQPYLTFELNRIDGVEPLSCNVNLYPNPTTESFTLETDEATARMRYSLYSLSGQMLQEGSFLQQTSVDVSDLSSGQYMLKVENVERKQSNVYKVIKIR